jgi:hypothetical protein
MTYQRIRPACILGIAIILLLLNMSVAHSQSTCNVAVSTTPAKSVYLKDEPIRLVLEYVNRGSTECQVLVEEPSFYGGLQFKDPSNKLAKRQEVSGGGIDLTKVITPGEKWSILIFLQTYFASPPVGTYAIQFEMTVHCKDGQSTPSSGNFSFQVSPSEPQQIRDIIAIYDRDLSGPERHNAVEALASMDTPLVIPELEKLIAIGDARAGFNALAKFKDSAEAQTSVRDFLSSKDSHNQAAALDVLSQWRLSLDDSQLMELAQLPDRSVKLAIIRYVSAVGQSGYRPVIERFVNDQDQYVSQQARGVAKSLADHK